MEKYQLFEDLQTHILPGTEEKRKKTTKDIIKVPWKKLINWVLHEPKTFI